MPLTEVLFSSLISYGVTKTLDWLLGSSESSNGPASTAQLPRQGIDLAQLLNNGQTAGSQYQQTVNTNLQDILKRQQEQQQQQATYDRIQSYLRQQKQEQPDDLSSLLRNLRMPD